MDQEIDIKKIQKRNDDVRKKFNNYELKHETARPICEYMAEAIKDCQPIFDGDYEVAVIVPNSVATTASFLLKLFITHYLDEGEEK